MSPSARDRLLSAWLRISAAVSAAVVVLIAVFLIAESWPALQRVGLWRFFADSSWHPAADAAAGTFNLAPMLAGTVLASLGAVLVATPLGVLSAVFCQFFAPLELAVAYRRLIELLAGIPSVVYGFWGLVVLVPLIRRLGPPGPSLLAGIAILAVMILPTVALQADAALAAVSRGVLRAAAAAGLSRRSLITGVALPGARAGILTGILLATGRALGETMAILMVCGNIVQVPASLFAPIRTLTANIALEMAYALDDHRSALFVSGLLLLLLVVALVALVELLRPRRAHA